MALSLMHMPKKRKVQWQVFKNFQDTWATKFPWVELVITEVTSYTMCGVGFALMLNIKENLLVQKLDGVHKHSGRKKCKYAKPRSLPKFLFLKWWNKNKPMWVQKKA
jgi:hypothetical protein